MRPDGTGLQALKQDGSLQYSIGLSLSADGSKLALLRRSDDLYVSVVDIKTGSEEILPGLWGGPELSWDPANRYLAGTTYGGKVQLYSFANRSISTIDQPGGGWKFDANGSYLVSTQIYYGEVDGYLSRLNLSTLAFEQLQNKATRREFFMAGADTVYGEIVTTEKDPETFSPIVNLCRWRYPTSEPVFILRMPSNTWLLAMSGGTD